LIWINAAVMNSRQSSTRQTLRALCHGRRADTPLSGPEDHRQSLSSRTQYRAGDDRRSLDAVCSSSPCAPLAGLATWRDHHLKCGRLYSLLVRFRGPSRPPRKPYLLLYGSHYDPRLARPREALGLYDRCRRTAGGDERLPRDLGRVPGRRGTLG